MKLSNMIKQEVVLLILNKTTLLVGLELMNYISKNKSFLDTLCWDGCTAIC